ncbi:MAG: CHC2 zinc finger domain-containing protein [Muribaculum sp.]|nr:CHC2 zinc finger domain-containing protein [Muribaculum sp.]
MHDDHTPSLKFLGRDKQDWWCFVCNKGGHGPISLVMAHEGIPFKDACLILGKMYGILIEGTPYTNRLYKPVRKIAPESHQQIDDSDGRPFQKEVCEWVVTNSCLSDIAKSFLFSERRLSERVVNDLNIGSISNSFRLREKLWNLFSSDILLESGLIKKETGNINLFTPCLIFPYYDMDGDLVGLQSRYLGEKGKGPRFQFISKRKTRLFNLPILKKLSKGDDLYISEGVTDCMALLSAGLNAVALPSATIIPEDDLYLIRDFNLKMYPDMDENGTGLECFYKIESYFIKMSGKIEKLLLPNGFKDFGEYYASVNSK